MNININGSKYEFSIGETIINVAKRNGIEIPSLCFDERFKPYTSCFVCIVRDEKRNKLIPSCSALATDGMNITTDDEEIKKLRKMAFELLLSEHDADCFSPCKTVCPANLDIRDYILYARTGDNFEGFLTMRRRNPLLASTGRVCPAFCEEDCSRVHIDEKVDIRLLKRYLADTIYAKHDKELFEHETNIIRKGKSDTKVAVIGGGPAGLASAYFLRLAGYSVKIFDNNEKLGGMLRYAIPSYRLPVSDLDREIDSIMRLGIEASTGKKIDKYMFKELSKTNDAVILSTGTWKESGLWLDEDKYTNIIPAISYLRSIVIGENSELGKNVIVVGGGNSALDAARVSIRKGANVKLVYRRTREQMPAHEVEIVDGINEGMELYELMSPVELVSSKTSGISSAVKFQKMKLSNELDASGRNKIIKTDEFETFEFDTLVYATGQKQEMELIDAVKELSLDNVYLCGDALRGASTVIEAVANARKVAYELIEKLDGSTEYTPKNEMVFYSQREPKCLVEEDFIKIKKENVKHLDPKIRRTNFEEVEFGHTNNTAHKESERCVNCGCKAVEDCDLRDYSIEYGADPLKYKENLSTGIDTHYLDKSTMNLMHEPSKCVKCGKCITVCSEIANANALSFIGRGAGVILSSNPENNIADSTCTLCGMCIDSCPTGALIEKLTPNTVWTNVTEDISNCQGCVLECNIKYGFQNSKKIRARSYDVPICSIGRWGFKYDYKEYQKYFRGKISKEKVNIDESRIIKNTDIQNCDYVLSLNYEPQNPRVIYEFKKLREKGVIIDIINHESKISDLSKYSKPLIVFNYFDHDSTLVDKVMSKFKNTKILPVYYRLIK